MRRVAADIEVATMSPYRRVADKDALLRQMMHTAPDESRTLRRDSKRSRQHQRHAPGAIALEQPLELRHGGCIRLEAGNLRVLACLIGVTPTCPGTMGVKKTTTLRFTIGDASPASDPVARFITSLR
jgi:hypothetical protein